jgi:hypothetical protein
MRSGNDPFLHHVLDAWADLPETPRSGILAMIDAVAHTTAGKVLTRLRSGNRNQTTRPLQHVKRKDMKKKLGNTPWPSPPAGWGFPASP